MHSLILFTGLLFDVIDWGQNGGNAFEDNDLSTYCVPEAGIDLIVLAFLYEYGDGIRAYSLSSQKEAETLDQQLWGAYGNTKSNVVHRPFGTTFFYNNPSCSVNGAINLGSWVTAGTVSSNTKILIGLPVSPYAATGTYDGAQYYPHYPQLGGVMLWSAGFSDININHGCNYAQQARKILNMGSPC
ncbi:uncharacterized protein BO87DRAFT_397397 [Aspergillus neoniger CBS 115656]|uniref:Chitinase n=1 Tax=Aspergillus neoniger (strain CBS 115656) TaxID=1448310 RepID=A0A318Z0T3_ASPNB|nr:hypothetical protein BO87DRAFT_397397 [Aspergillus neoniger CBS 115656]PYH33738.1 hypothetical protein BO87DRAFT_397397 [Aspergillus neoniger CBS 115656]